MDREQLVPLCAIGLQEGLILSAVVLEARWWRLGAVNVLQLPTIFKQEHEQNYWILLV